MKVRTRIFRRFAIAIFAVFVLNTAASFFYWYDSFFWFDMMMHFFGGITVGLFTIWLFYRLYGIWQGDKKFLKVIFLNSVIFILVAVLWEIMEFSVQSVFDIGTLLATPLDSLSDILFGLMGNFIATTYFFIKLKTGDFYGRN